MVENRIKELRKLRKMTQVELAQKIGVTQGAIQKLENGVMDLTTKWMLSISQALDVKPYEILPQEWQPEEISPELKQFYQENPNLEQQMYKLKQKQQQLEKEANEHEKTNKPAGMGLN